MTPAYAVIFTSVRTEGDNGYAQTAERMLELARTMPGFLGVESARDEIGVTVSYWQSLEDIERWRTHPEHLVAQQAGRKEWYESFSVRVCKIHKEYHSSRNVTE